ncbi:WhiB family transcriptional regulator [Streptomyces sp. NPDC001982]|uniref:WhiB family transcriptional regulator n=1 Tax=Streptomyces sp. NPDC001982 TaxID=3154405 RepID=UPI00333061A8
MDWRERAICWGADPDLFFPVGNSSSGPTLIQTDGAKAVCRRCPVMRECLQWAIEVDPVEGVWGGTTEQERRVMKARLMREFQKATAPAA